MSINQELLSELKMKMIYSDDEVVEEYYGIQINVYKNIDVYLEKLSNIYDKIALSQWANNYEKANELISTVCLPEEQQNKYNKLLLNNSDLNETIDLRVLFPKYDFLNDILDMVVTNRDVQEQILSLSDEKLEVFKTLINRLCELEEYKIPQITAILNRMGTITPFTSWQNGFYRYSDLEESICESIRKGEKLTTEEIDNLLYLYTTNIVWNIKTRVELKKFLDSNGLFFRAIDSIIKKQESDETPNIEIIKNALLLKTFGIDLISAKSICGRYDLNSIEINKDNIDLFEMYKAMFSIIDEKDSELLLSAYYQFSQEMNPNPNFLRTIVFENSLRKEFALKLNLEVYKCNDNYEMVENVPIYNAGTNFKMIVTAIGAYQGDFSSKDNYSDYWNSPSIRSHCNCCSLIANNNLSMANPRNVIFGFSTMDENMLLLSSTKDINSTPKSREFNIAEEEYNGNNRTIDGEKINSIGKMGVGIEYTSPDILIDNTRGDYNELVYERRDLSSNPSFYKKNPDYIVFIEEYENIDEYFEQYKNDENMLAYLREQKRMQDFQFNESLKAAQNFGIPIVKINREKCAKNSICYIINLVEEFEITKNPTLISHIICEFENNRVGNHDKHAIIREQYFSKDKMNEILNRIETCIFAISDQNEKNILLNHYYNCLKKEEVKVNKCKNYRKNGQTSSIEFKTIIDKVEAMLDGDMKIAEQSSINLPIRR